MKKTYIVLLIVFVSVYLYSGPLKIGTNFSTNGIGLEINQIINSYFKVRTGINVKGGKNSSYSFKSSNSSVFIYQNNSFYYSSTSFSSSLLTASATQNIFSVPFCVDYSPFQNSFIISFGLFYNGDEFSFNAKGSSIGGGETGSINATCSSNKIAPYIGLRYDNTFGVTSKCSYVVDLGYVYTGNPQKKIITSGIFDSDTVKLAVSQMIDDKYLKTSNIVFSLGLGYRF